MDYILTLLLYPYDYCGDDFAYTPFTYSGARCSDSQLIESEKNFQDGSRSNLKWIAMTSTGIIFEYASYMGHWRVLGIFTYRKCHTFSWTSIFCMAVILHNFYVNDFLYIRLTYFGDQCSASEFIERDKNCQEWICSEFVREYPWLLPGWFFEYASFIRGDQCSAS